MSIKPISTIKLTGVGQIKASPGYLLWINVSNTSGSGRKVTLHNATSGTTGEVMQIGVSGSDSKFLNFGAGFHFSLGIRCGAMESELVVTAGYD